MAITRDIPKAYPEEALLEELRRVAELVGRTPLTAADFKKHSKVSVSTLKRRFGSWRDALEWAGLGGLSAHWGRRCPYTDEQLLEEVRRVAQLVDKPFLTMADFGKHSTVSLWTLLRRFKKWRIVLECAGLGHRSCRVADVPEGLSHARYSNQMLLNEVRRVARLVDRPVLTQADFAKHSSVGIHTLTSRFGGWRGVLEHAGLQHMHSSAIRGSWNRRPDEVLLEEIRRVAGLLDKPIFMRADFDTLSEISSNSVIQRFGSWRAALERAGLGHMYFTEVERQIVRPARYTDEELLDEVRRVAKLVGKDKLRGADFDSRSRIGLRTLSRRFGSWRDVLEQAGLKHLYAQGTLTGRRRSSVAAQQSASNRVKES